jgi:predicted nuclease of restriction endonuclease-like (RecB) superfamily
MSEIKFHNYSAVLNELKEKIKQARIKAALTVNKELLQTYWDIGSTIAQQEKAEGWGAGIVKSLSKDLRLEFPDMQGISPRNLRYMRDFALSYPNFPILQAPLAKLGSLSYVCENQDSIILQAPLAKLSWYHHLTLLDKVKDPGIRQFYIIKTIENGWSRNTMVYWIEAELHLRHGPVSATSKSAITSGESELIQQLFKDPYNFDFLQLTEKAKERDVENALIQHIKKFLLELGEGFAFMGQQYKVNAGEKEYIIDLLFYHTKLRRYIVIELKIGDFEPEFIGKMNLYLGIVDDTLKGIYDEGSIGLILCKTKDKVIAEYALRDTGKLIGISEYKIVQALPENIKGELPSIEELEQKMDEEFSSVINPFNTRLKAIKDKLNNIATEEIQTQVTFTILSQLYYKSLRSLYQMIIEMFSGFNELFHECRYEWCYGNSHIENFIQFDEIWKNDKGTINDTEIIFDYRLLGFRKAGTENYSIQIRLRFEIDKYWYGFSIDYSNSKPFLKKLYHQNLSSEDKRFIVDYLSSRMLDQIELIVGRIEEKV